MLYLASRKEFVAFLEPLWQAQFPTYKLYYDNGPAQPNLETGTEPFLYVDFVFNDADLASMEAVPKYRFRGKLELMFFVKEGTGLNETLAVFDWLVATILPHRFTNFSVNAPLPSRPVKPKGWHGTPLYVPVVSSIV